MKSVTEEDFWDQAEKRVMNALKVYAERAENGHLVRRRLFSEDAAHGFAFIDLCHKRYDVVLMNPPFGDPSISIVDLFATKYSRIKTDLYGAFIEMVFIFCRQTDEWERLRRAPVFSCLRSRSGERKSFWAKHALPLWLILVVKFLIQPW